MRVKEVERFEKVGSKGGWVYKNKNCAVRPRNRWRKMEVGLKREEEKGGLGERLVGWLIGSLGG